MMGGKDKFMLNTHFDLVNLGSADWVFRGKMAPFLASFTLSVSALLLALFRFFRKMFISFNKDESLQVKNSCCSSPLLEESRMEPNPIEPEGLPMKADTEAWKSGGDSEFNDVGDGETSEPGFVFKFEFQTREILSRSNKEDDFLTEKFCLFKEEPQVKSSSSSRKYEFKARENLSCFMEEDKVASFTVKDVHACNFNGGSIEAGVHEEIPQDFADGGCKVEESDKKSVMEDPYSEEEELGCPENDSACEKVDSHKFMFLSENEEPQVTSSSSSRYEFKVGESLSCFMEEAKVASFTVMEETKVASDSSSVSNSIEASVHEEETEKESVMEEPHSDEDRLGSEKNNSSGEKVDSHEAKFLSEKDFVASDSDSDSDSIGSSLVFSARTQSIGSPSYGFLSEEDFGESDELGALKGIDFENVDIGYEPDGFVEDEEDEDIMEQLRELEELPVNDHHSPNSSNSNSNPEGVSNKDEKPMDDLEKSAEPYGHNLAANDFEDSNTLESLWEHQELIEQLKMELKKVKATGLPTILEESESPNMDDLKPWKIDEKVHHGDRIGELHKFYRSYRERMRKFDILNYQKLYAIGFLQSKEPLQSFPSCKSSTPASKSLLSHNFWRSKPKKDSDSDPMVKFIRELHSDLEVVYVGQLCLSWEFLQWQYEKAFDLWESDPYGIVSYNEVADEFQQFQVLLQRFVENERFQGPRVENYVKNRCVMRNLLQVPVIRGDNLKDRKKARRKGKDDGAITSDILVEILEESIRNIWRFIRADKFTNSSIVCQKRGREELQDSDSKLLMEMQTDLQKKERKLKEMLRSGSCILKRFKKHEDDGIDYHLYFFSQVDMKLVSRVLNMSSITTEQLVWCHNKLSKIHFVNRKIRVDPSFLLFPC